MCLSVCTSICKYVDTAYFFKSKSNQHWRIPGSSPSYLVVPCCIGLHWPFLPLHHSLTSIYTCDFLFGLLCGALFCPAYLFSFLIFHFVPHLTSPPSWVYLHCTPLSCTCTVPHRIAPRRMHLWLHRFALFVSRLSTISNTKVSFNCGQPKPRPKNQCYWAATFVFSF